MLSIFVLFFLVFICIFLLRQYPYSKWIKFSLLAFFNLLVLECFCYGYFIYLINKGDSFFLIGNQWLLDRLIKSNLVDFLYLNPDRHNNFYQIDRDLGYTIGKNKTDFVYHTNAQGIRADRNYPLIPSKDVLRMAVFGDSFVFCDWEPNKYTWPSYLERSVGNLEVMNFGVSGYGLGQSYARYLKDGLRFHPDIIFFNYIKLGNRDRISAQDIFSGRLNIRQSSLYRIHYEIKGNVLVSKVITPFDLFDPVFRQKYIYEPYNIDFSHLFWSNKIFSVSNLGLFLKDIFLRKEFADLGDETEYSNTHVTAKLLNNLLSVAEQNGSMVIFFVDIEFKDLEPEIQNVLLRHSKDVIFVNSRRALDAHFKARGVIDKKTLLNKSGHYNARGNLYYAEVIASILKGRIWGRDGRQFRFDELRNAFVRM